MKRKALNILLRLWFIPVLMLAVTGCVAPKTVARLGGNLEGYQKVYFVTTGDDPREVFPRVAYRLRKTGFAVTVVNPHHAPIEEQGSAFVISPEGYVLTCAHVVGDLTNATIWIEGTRYPCAVLNRDTNLDLALLKVEGSHPPFYSLRLKSGNDYSLGQNVYTLGFPLADVLGTSPRLDNGLVNAKVGMNDNTNYLQISVPVQPGNSGGPLLDANSEVIGVISSTLNPMGVLVRTGGALPQNVNFAIKLSSVQNFLAASKVAIPAGKNAAQNFDQAEQAIALVRSGNASDEELQEKALLCVCRYVSMYSLGWRFRLIGIVFIDSKTRDVVLTVATRSQSFAHYSEEQQLDSLFAKISTAFFPDRPNPFE